jgi:hypothetical protein
MVKVREEKDFKPVCPHCTKATDEIIAVRHGELRRHYIYCCPHCRKILFIEQAGP